MLTTAFTAWTTAYSSILTFSGTGTYDWEVELVSIDTTLALYPYVSEHVIGLVDTADASAAAWPPTGWDAAPYYVWGFEADTYAPPSSNPRRAAALARPDPAPTPPRPHTYPTRLCAVANATK